jgi:Zn-dependent peptidase ImmA (M78 family)
MFSGNYLFVDTDEIYAFFRPNEWNNMSEEYKQYEREANRFAAELLMPEDVIRKAYVEL